MATKPGIDQGKRAFVEDYLKKDPSAGHQEIAGSWESGGRDGTISQSYVGKLRGDLGLTRRSRAGRPKAEAVKEAKAPGTAKRGRPRGSVSAKSRANGSSVVEEPKRAAVARERGGDVAALEAEFDRLLYRVMDRGDMTEVEDLIRKARRHLITHH